MPYLTNDQKRQLLKKLRPWCGAAMRSHLEVKQKLYGLGLWRRDVEELLSDLIQTGHINETAFAHRFVERQQLRATWGRQKIRNNLISKNVSDYNIKGALATIDEAAYRQCCLEQAKQKWCAVKGPGVNLAVKMRKTGQFLLQRGYESALVWEALILLRNKEL